MEPDPEKSVRSGKEAKWIRLTHSCGKQENSTIRRNGNDSKITILTRAIVQLYSELF